MKKKQFSPLEIDCFETEEYPLPRHSHTYYELVYIFKGCGNHHLNNLIMPYKAGDLYLISPEDEHYFDIKKQTKFAFIKFNDSFFESNKHLAPDTLMTASPMDIMRNPMLKEIKLCFDEPCKTILRKTVENIVDYDKICDVTTSPIMFFQVLSLFGLIREASAKLNVRIDNGVPSQEDLISYIHQNIYRPETIRIKTIASHFNISPTYFSAYFKRNFEMSYRNYINNYRLALIEKRIESGKNTIKQIAYEFGFTDESHLSHYFKNKKSKTLGSYKVKSKNLTQSLDTQLTNIP
ncbi:AraC family transcriptional regulator [Epilithonimonas zeae]|uniref:AraC family transcriptional regulator n=1 Tax=Epilithonimonas zeae TaxID=1416779 RepID=UPI00200BEA78|nr:AraC family transcriptional regulator [Epilithonimonas zeae]UQB68575.1 helix-turn-helix domain-containing protein [Epilithonimonas zeae]